MSRFYPPFKYFCISKFTLFLALFIIISASFTRQIMDFIKASIGGQGFLYLIATMAGILGLFFLICAIRNSYRLVKVLIFVVIWSIGLVLTWQIEIPEERIHILEYAVLGWFSVKDLNRKSKKVRASFLACVYCVIVGILDELFQAILPYRFFDWRDVIFNGAGGGWGITLYLLS